MCPQIQMHIIKGITKNKTKGARWLPQAFPALHLPVPPAVGFILLTVALGK